MSTESPSSEIRCKRIIDGRTYNTETASLLGRWESDDYPLEQALFKTRHGAYFLYEDLPNEPDERIKPLEPEDAQKWMEQHCRPELIEAEFGEMPEAGDPEARITLRVPETLRKRIVTIAVNRNQSLNSWIQRCLERCSETKPGPPFIARNSISEEVPAGISGGNKRSVEEAIDSALRDLFEIGVDFLAVGTEIASQPRPESLAGTVCQLLRTVSNSMRSVLILVRNGCGTDALKIARTMFETAVNIHYLHSHPETVADYIDFIWIKKKKHHDYLLKFAPAQAGAVDQITLNELNAEYARVSPRFTGSKGKVRNAWHRSDHREISRSIGGEIMYGGLYPFISSLTHMDVLGLQIACHPSGEVEDVPSGANCELGLQIAMVSYAMALMASDEVLATGREDQLQKIFERFKKNSSVRRQSAIWNELGRRR